MGAILLDRMGEGGLQSEFAACMCVEMWMCVRQAGWGLN
jgi:hypothetical protein